MTKKQVLWNLQEAAEELDRTIREVQSNPEYGEEELLISMSHLYHHLNTAWNIRHEDGARVDACSEADFARWRQFPTDIDMMLGLE
jgi:hypothetical protein